MNLDLNGYRLHLVFSPADMRNGYRTLSAIASSCLQLDISEGKDCVVFVSARRTLCKAIWADAVGASMQFDLNQIALKINKISSKRKLR